MSSKERPRSASSVAQRGAELVGGRLAHGGEAPVLDQLLAREGAEVGLGVADVDDQEHGARIMLATPWPPSSTPSPASHPCATVRRALRAEGRAVRARRLLPLAHAAVQRLRFGRARCRASQFADGDEGRRLAARSCAALDERVPEPPLLPPTRRQRRRVEGAEAGATRCCSRWPAASSGPRCAARPGAMASTSASARAAAARGRCARLGAPLDRAARERARPRRGRPDVRADLHPPAPSTWSAIDGWIEDGMLGGEQPTPPTCRSPPRLRLLLTIEDVARAIDARPAGRARARAGSPTSRARCRRARCPRVAARPRPALPVRPRAAAPRGRTSWPGPSSASASAAAPGARDDEVGRELEQRDEHEAARVDLLGAGSVRRSDA